MVLKANLASSVDVASSILQFDANNITTKMYFCHQNKANTTIDLTISPFDYSDDKTHTTNTDDFDAMFITSRLQTKQSRISPYFTDTDLKTCLLQIFAANCFTSTRT